MDEPGGQAAHDILPAAALYVPAGQLVHDRLPLALNDPDEQITHVDEEFAPVAGL